MAKALVQSGKDNVATMLTAVRAGETVECKVGDQVKLIVASSDIQFGHKIAIQDICQGENIYKYGQVIGRCIASIGQGAHVHVHNVESLRARGDLQGGLSCH